MLQSEMSKNNNFLHNFSNFVKNEKCVALRACDTWEK